MSRLPLAFVLVLGIVAGLWIYQSPSSEAGETAVLVPEVEASGGAESGAGAPELELLTPARDAVREAEVEQPELPASGSTPSEPSGATPEPPSNEAAPTPVDELANWSGPWPKYVEEARRKVLDRGSSLDDKGSALKSLELLRAEDGEDPRSEEVLLEAAWILKNTDDAGVLDDVLDGIENIQHDALVEPVISLLLNHESAKVRSGAVSVLLGYPDSERARVALEHAAQYDEDARVRDKAGSAE